MLVAFGLFCFLMLVIIHEYGHYLVARRNGVEAEEFGIGFPPKVIGKTMGKGIFRTYYSLNLLPIGGFVKLKGETDSDTRKGSLGAASLWVKTKIMMAGVFMNWITAVVILTILAWVGMPQLVENQFSVASDAVETQNQVLIGFVEDDSPAQRAGFETGDEVVRFDGVEIERAEDLFNATQTNAGQTVEVEVLRGGERLVSSATLNETNQEQGYFGVTPSDLSRVRSTWSAPVVGVGLTAQLSWETLKGLGGLVTDIASGDTESAGEQVSGPVGIFFLLQTVSTIGIVYVFFLIAIISLTLAIMNALPIPALDGGRLFVTMFFRLIKRPLTPKLEQAIHGSGMVALLLLIVLVTAIDIQRNF